MAQVTSGSFKTTAYQGRYLLFSWTATQSVEKNQSTISWTLKGAGEASASWYKAGNFKVIIAGETVYSSSARIQLYNGTTVASGTKVLTHGTDGTKKFSASAQAGIYTTAVNCSGSGSWELKTIARKATLLSAPNFNDEANPTITYSNPAGSAVTTLQACITLDGSNADIAYRNISKTGSSYTFNLTDAERKVLRAATTSSNSRTVIFRIKTVIGSTTFLSSVTKTLSIINAAPIVTANIYVPDGTTYDLTGSRTTLIKNYSWIPYSMTVEPQKEAEIVSHSASHNNVSNTALSGMIKTSIVGNTVTFTAKDSRGNVTTITKTVNVIEYFKPIVSVDADPPTTDGTLTFTIKGKYFKGSFGAVTNAFTLRYALWVNGAQVETPVVVSPTMSDNGEFTATITRTGLDYRNTFTLHCAVYDSICTDGVKITPLVLRTTPAFDWGANDFNFNVPVNFNTGFNAGGNVLWSGSAFMNGRDIQLSEKISDQANGIVLIFSLYRNGAAEDVSINSFFVSKHTVALLEGCPHTFIMAANATFPWYGGKYLYIYDDHIGGYTGNGTTGTTTAGITISNTNFVLRYVIGV